MKNIYEQNDIIQDSSNGDSYIVGNDFTTATFEKGQVTDTTTLEENTKHLGQMRTVEKNTASPQNNHINYIFILFTLCAIITIVIIVLPLIANKKED